MQTNDNRAVIVAYGRSAIARSGKGSFRSVHPLDFAAQVLEGVLKKVPQLPLDQIEDLIVGCAKPERQQGSNAARLLALRAGLPNVVGGSVVNRFCASGLQAIASASAAIEAGHADVILAGGMESMTCIPIGSDDPAHKNGWILSNMPDLYMSMGLTAENVAAKYGVTRPEMEEFAVLSQTKAAKAQAEHRFDDQIIPVDGVDAEGNTVCFQTDECVRGNTTTEGLAKLKPSFRADGLVTAGTSSPVSDGASFIVIMSERKAKELGIRPIARLVSFSVAGVDPSIMGIGPIYAVPKALARAGLTADDMDVIELNEAFAAQSIPCIRELGLNPDKVNPNGGALALGHPLGATGAILTCKALSHLERTGGKYAMVTMCIGGGMGAAGIFERC